MWSKRASSTITSPPARPVAPDSVQATTRSGMTVCDGRRQRLDPSTSMRDGARPPDGGPHGAEVLRQVADLGLAGGVLDHRRALGERRRHHEVVGRRVARVVEHDAGADERGPDPPGADRPIDEAVGRLEVGPHGGQAVHVEVDRAASRSRRRRASRRGPGRSGRAAARGPRSRPASSLPARRGPRGRAPPWRASRPPGRPSTTGCTVAPSAVSISAMISTSRISGTLTRRWRPSASRQAAISLSAEFLAPPARDGPLERAVRADQEAVHGPSIAHYRRELW